MNEVTARLTKTEYLIINVEEGLVVVCDTHEAEELDVACVKRLYRIIDQKQGLLEEIDIVTIRRSLVEHIRDKVDVDKMLEQALKTVDPKDVIEALKRVSEGGKEKIKPHKGCYSLIIKGRKGQRPLEIVLAQ